MKKLNKFLCLLIVISVVLCNAGFPVLAADSQKSCYYIDSVNGDEIIRAQK